MEPDVVIAVLAAAVVSLAIWGIDGHVSAIRLRRERDLAVTKFERAVIDGNVWRDIARDLSQLIETVRLLSRRTENIADSVKTKP